jgi:PAS domain S-box-containing protein
VATFDDHPPGADYRLLLESLADPVFVVGKGAVVTFCNETGAALCRPFGLEGPIGRRFTELLHPQDWRMFEEGAERARKTGSPFLAELRVSVDAETWRWFEVQVVGLPHSGNDQILVSLHEITERRRMQELLSNAAYKWRTTFDSVGDALCLLDRDRRIRQCNRAFAELAGKGFPEILGKTPCELLHLSRVAIEQCPFPVVVETGSRRSLEFEEQQQWFHLSIDPVMDEQGTVAGAVHCLKDITERKHLEAQLFEAQKLEALGTLTRGIAHDFNNILSVILSIAGFLKGDLPENSPLRDDVEQIRLSGERAATLVRQLLAFSRRQIASPEPVRLNDLLQNLVPMLKRLIGEDIEIVLSPDPALEEINADAGQVEQVVVNLAANARDAMPGGGKLIIETHHAVFDDEYVRQHVGAMPGRYVVLSVSDTGTGMSEEVKARIFEPFFTTKDVGKGTGLGLSTVYGIVKQHGGHVWVYSQPGRGTTFRVSFPVRSDGEKAGPKPAAPEAVDLRGHETVLVVEDDPVVRRSVRRILKQYGYDVIEAADGREGLLAAQETVKPIDLLLTDVVLPGLDGHELAEKVKLLHPEAKVLFMSGYTDTVIAHHGILDPGVAFIAKPFSSEALGKKVREVLRTDAPVEVSQAVGSEPSSKPK